MSILDELACHANERVERNKTLRPLGDVKRMALKLPKGEYEFENALKKPGLSFICEVKRASPSKGMIAPVFDPLKTAKEYEAAGADAISCLTEPKWFLGSDEYLSKIAESVSVPCLRKDFTVDEYMIYEAKLLGAKAVLLIVSILDDAELKDYLEITRGLGMSALIEAHDENEIGRALSIGAGIIGVNNRNLKDFSVDNNNSLRLRRLIPSNVLFVSESGVKHANDTLALENAGVDAALVGEALMRAPDKGAKLKELRGEK